MSSRLSFQEAIHDPGSVALAIFQAIGWEVDLGTVVSTNDIQTEELKVFPNPARYYVNISWPDDFPAQVNYLLTDALGKTVQSGKLGSQQQLHLSNFPAGTYFLKLFEENRQYVAQILKID